MKVLIIDNSLYVPLAQRLGESGLFEKVGYFSEWKTDFTQGRDFAVGSGFESFTREFELYDALDLYDGFIFSDLYHADLQTFLREQNALVWGAGPDEYLEIDRVHLLDVLPDITPEAEVVQGLDAAVAVAEEGDYIKIPGFTRGDMETCAVDASGNWYHELKLKLGPLAEYIDIVVQKPIKGGVEAGFDNIVYNGRFLRPGVIGYEAKDQGYIGVVTNKTPSILQPVEKAVEDALSLDYNCFLSTEVLQGKLIDITCRMPSPPGVVLSYNANLPQVMLSSLKREIPGRLFYHSKYMAELIIKTKKPQLFHAFEIPKELQERVFVRRGFKFEGKLYSSPLKSEDLCEIGDIIAFGDTAEDACEELEYIADELKLPPSCEVNVNVLDELMETIENGKEEGIDFE